MSKICQVCGIREGREMGNSNPFGDDLNIIVCEECLLIEIKNFLMNNLMSDKYDEQLYRNFWTEGPFRFPENDAYLNSYVVSELMRKAANT